MNDLERHVLLEIGDDPDSPDVFSEEKDLVQIRDSISDAVQEVVMLTGSYKRTFLLPLRKGRSFYRLAFKRGYFGWVTDAWLHERKIRLNQTDWGKLDHLDPRWMTRTGFPEEYMQIGLDILGVSPRPSATDDVLSLTCVVIPSRLETDKDRVAVRNDFKRAVVRYAVAEYWAGRGDAKSAAMSFQEYREMLGMRRDKPRDQHPGLQTDKEPWPTESARGVL